MAKVNLADINLETKGLTITKGDLKIKDRTISSNPLFVIGHTNNTVAFQFTSTGTGFYFSNSLKSIYTGAGVTISTGDASVNNLNVKGEITYNK